MLVVDATAALLDLIQAETLASAVINDWLIHVVDEAGATDAFRRAAAQLGLDVTTGP